MSKSLHLFTEPADAAQRARALDCETSFAIEAPAGSGKTATLIQRYLKLLALQDTSSPERVLAITFTRKAAAEMKDRILAELRAASAEPAFESTDAFKQATRTLALAALAHSSALGWDILSQPDAINVRTIDSLSTTIANRLPILSEAGGRLNPTEKARDLHLEAASRTLAQLGGGNAALTAALRIVLLHRDGNLANCQQLIATMLARREQWGHILPPGNLTESQLDTELRPALERTLQRPICQTLAALQQGFPAHLLLRLTRLAEEFSRADGHPPPSPFLHCAARTVPPGITVQDLDHWRALASLLVPKSDAKWRQAIHKGTLKILISKSDVQTIANIIAEVQHDEDLLSLLVRLRDLPPPTYPEQQWRVIKALFIVLQHALVELRLLFAERSQCDFPECTLAARTALINASGNNDLAEALGSEIRHLLVDEMQDTSAAQYDLLELLTAGWDGHSQTVFLVGDPKQSIYLFRQARVERFLETLRNRRLGHIDLETLKLSANFRSQAALVQQFNNDFAEIFPTTSDPGLHYTPAIPTRPAKSGSSAQWHTFTFDKADPFRTKEHAAEEEAAAVTALVAEIQLRPLPADRTTPWQIAILIRARNDLAHITPALRAAGIAYSAVDIDPLASRPEVLDLIALARLLLHPADRTAWLAALRAPWCGLTLRDLHAVAGADDATLNRHTIAQLIDSRASTLSLDGQQRLARTTKIFTAAAEQFQRTPFTQLLDRTWRSLGGDLCVAPAHLPNAGRFFQMLATIEAEGPVTLDAIDSRIANLFAQATPSNVELMTIHTAKGLERDFILVPALESTPPPDRPPLLNWLELTARTSENSVVLAPIAGKGEDNDDLNRWINSVRKQRIEAERKRLYYVACTRAREELHLFATAQQKDGMICKPDARSLLNVAWPTADSHFHPVVAPSNLISFSSPVSSPAEPGLIMDIAAAATAPSVTIRRLPLTVDPIARFTDAAAPLPEAIAPTTHKFFQRPEGSLAARNFGNAVHAFAEQLATKIAAHQSPAMLLAELPTWQPRIAAVLRAGGISPTQLPTLTQQTLTALNNLLSDSTGLWLLAPHPQSASESAISGLDEGAGTLRLDRTFLAGPDPETPGTSHLWIVDFKTADRTADIEAFLAREKEKYREQMEAYARAKIQQLGPTQIRLALYYPMLPRLIWWPY